MIQFCKIHLIYKEENNEDDEYEDQQMASQKKSQKKTNLKELKSEVFSTYPLTKSTRKLYRDLK